MEGYYLLVLRSFALVCLEADLKYSIAECVTVETLNCHNGLLVVGHRHEAEALALVRLQIPDHLH